MHRLMLFRPAAAGQEVTLSYGPLPNAKLLLFYGFTVQNNPFDSAVVPLDVCGRVWDGRERAVLAPCCCGAPGIVWQGVRCERRGSSCSLLLLAAAR